MVILTAVLILTHFSDTSPMPTPPKKMLVLVVMTAVTMTTTNDSDDGGDDKSLLLGTPFTSVQLQDNP